MKKVFIIASVVILLVFTFAQTDKTQASIIPEMGCPVIAEVVNIEDTENFNYVYVRIVKGCDTGSVYKVINNFQVLHIGQRFQAETAHGSTMGPKGVVNFRHWLKVKNEDGTAIKKDDIEVNYLQGNEKPLEAKDNNGEKDIFGINHFNIVSILGILILLIAYFLIRRNRKIKKKMVSS